MRRPYPGRLGPRAIANHHLNPCRLELAQEQRVLRASARQAVRRLDVQTIDASIRNRLAQAIQARTSQRCAAVAVVDELSLSWYAELIFQNLDAQGRQLLGDG
jgi:hypothetical protein